MRYIIYKIQNTINGKFYIGAHKTKNINDSYMGSGVAIQRAIKKYGKSNFIKTILLECDSETEMYEMERKIVKIGLNTYNLTNGGRGGFSHIDKSVYSGDNNIMRRNVNVKNEIIKKREITKNKNKEYYDEISKKNLEKAVTANTGKKRPEHSELMKVKAKLMWSDSDYKNRWRDNNSSTYTIISPEGCVIITNRLAEFCDENKFCYTTLWKSAHNNTPVIKRGKLKGWKCSFYDQK